MKLKCVDHERRVHIVDQKLVHRGSQKHNSPCSSSKAKIGNAVLSVFDGYVRIDTPEERLLRDIFQAVDRPVE